VSDQTGGAPFPPASYAWFAVAALSLVNMVSYVERQILTLLFTPIKADFALSDTEVSLLAGAAFVIFYVVFGLLFGRLADRVNRKRLVMIGAVFWGLATAACGAAQNFIQLFVARICVGVGEASLGPSALSIISDYFPRERLVRPISVYAGSQYVGAGFALVVGGLAIEVVAQLPPLVVPGLGPLRPWQLVFILVGLAGMLPLLLMAFVREPLRRGLAAAPTAAERLARRSQLIAFFSANRRMLFAHFAGFSLSSMLGFGVAAWMPTYFIRVHGWAAQDIGYAYGAVMAVMGLTGALTGGRLAEWLQDRGVVDVHFAMPMVTMTLNAILLAAAVFAPSGVLALVFVGLMTLIGTLPLSLIQAALQSVSPNQLRGQLVALFGFVANLVGVASGPTLVALITDYGFHDEQAVGLSLVTLNLCVTPVVVALLGFGRAGLRHSLARASDLYRQGAPA
jgi:MFS family permease